MNLRTQQGFLSFSKEHLSFKFSFEIEVDQMRRKDRLTPKRLLLPTSIVTNLSISAKQQKNLKQQGRPISSVFITQDPVDSFLFSCFY